MEPEVDVKEKKPQRHFFQDVKHLFSAVPDGGDAVERKMLPEVEGWLMATTTAGFTGFIAGGFRGAAKGHAAGTKHLLEKARVALIPNKHRNEVMRKFVYNGAARGSLGLGVKMTAFVSLLTGVPVMALYVPEFRGPMGYLYAGATAALALSYSRGPKAIGFGVPLGAALGAIFGMTVQALDAARVKLDAAEAAKVAEEAAKKKDSLKAKD